jgi:hypothetical protein
MISIYASAVRTDRWMDLYNSIGENEVPFELVFVGPKAPDFTLPDNFRFIKSDAKPSQCWAIAADKCKYDLIMNIADDIVFMDTHPIDSLYSSFKTLITDRFILSGRYMLNGQDRTWAEQVFNLGDYTSPLMPVCSLMSKKLFNEIGGIDRNFNAVCWDLDIAMRLLASGGMITLSNVFVNEVSPNRDLYFRNCGHDRKLLDELWMVDGKLGFKRLREVEPFTAEEISGN